jgi:hypothetical protein
MPLYQPLAVQRICEGIDCVLLIQKHKSDLGESLWPSRL